MLNPKQPQADRRREQKHRAPGENDDEGCSDQRHADNHAARSKIGTQYADPASPIAARAGRRHTVMDQQKIKGTRSQHHQRIAIEPVQQFPPGRLREVLSHGEGGYVARAAKIEVAGRRMVDRVGAPPRNIGNERQQADREAYEFVGATRSQE